MAFGNEAQSGWTQKSQRLHKKDIVSVSESDSASGVSCLVSQALQVNGAESLIRTAVKLWWWLLCTILICRAHNRSSWKSHPMKGHWYNMVPQVWRQLWHVAVEVISGSWSWSTRTRPWSGWSSWCSCCGGGAHCSCRKRFSPLWGTETEGVKKKGSLQPLHRDELPLSGSTAETSLRILLPTAVVSKPFCSVDSRGFSTFFTGNEM